MARSLDPAPFTPAATASLPSSPAATAVSWFPQGSPLYTLWQPRTAGGAVTEAPTRSPATQRPAPPAFPCSACRAALAARSLLSSAGSRTKQFSPAARQVARGGTIGRTPLDEGVGLRGSGCGPIRGSVSTDTGTILARPEGAAPGVGEGMLGFLGSVSRFVRILFGSVTSPHYALGEC